MGVKTLPLLVVVLLLTCLLAAGLQSINQPAKTPLDTDKPIVRACSSDHDQTSHSQSWLVLERTRPSSLRIQATIRKLYTITEPTKAATLFARILRQLDRHNAGAAWEALSEDWSSRHKWREPFLEAWGSLDGLAAIEAASVNGSPYDRERLQAMALSGYVSDDSEGAISGCNNKTIVEC
ncbi:hypothetical protein N8586_05635 [Verrucomicrobiales bacterium]|nr:hypothetical protein [Verrucomicrobiales bacterium]